MLLLKVNATNPEEVRKALVSLCNIDDDMNGNNGDEYLWEVAKEKGYENNAEYLADLVLNNPTYKTVSEKLEAFAKEFFVSNDYYYKGYELEHLEDGDDIIVAFHMW